jgi:hypothetical protein
LREIVDLNFQSGPDATLPARWLLYNAALHLRYGVPVRSLAVLLRRKAYSKRLTGKLAYTGGRSRVEFHYETVCLWRQPVAPFLEGGIGLLPLAMLCELPKGEPALDALRESFAGSTIGLRAKSTTALPCG